MPKVKVSDVKVGKRFRTNYGDMDSLAVSIQRFGLLHPIVVTKGLELIAGERRLRAHKSLGLDEIEVKFIDDVGELEKKEIEVEENIARKSFTWQEEVAAKLIIDQLKRKRYGSAVKGHSSDGWGIKDTADALGESVGQVSMDIQLAEALAIYPELSREKTKTSAYKKFKRLRERDLREELARRGVVKEMPFIHLGDCAVVMREKIESDSIDLIITDPQFGINLDRDDAGKVKSFVGVYSQDDTPERVFSQLQLALVEMYRILKLHSHLYLFFSPMHYTTVRRLLEESKFRVSPIPLIWYKERPSTPGSAKAYVSSYEACFFCSKEQPKELLKPHMNVFVEKGVPPAKRVHPTEKPVSLLRHFVLASSVPGETVLDPYAGSGSTLEAAITLGRKAVGIDIDKRYYTSILERMHKLVDEKEGKDDTSQS